MGTNVTYLVARIYANAGTSGFFGKGDMQKEFEEASFALKHGEISHVVKTASGLHLIERYVSNPSSRGMCRTACRSTSESGYSVQRCRSCPTSQEPATHGMLC